MCYCMPSCSSITSPVSCWGQALLFPFSDVGLSIVCEDRPPDKSAYLENYFLYFSSKTYVVGPQTNRLNENFLIWIYAGPISGGIKMNVLMHASLLIYKYNTLTESLGPSFAVSLF